MLDKAVTRSIIMLYTNRYGKKQVFTRGNQKDRKVAQVEELGQPGQAEIDPP